MKETEEDTKFGKTSCTHALKKISIVKISIAHNEISRLSAIPIKMVIFAGGVAQEVERLLNNNEALSSSTSTIKKALWRKTEKQL
jgi:hypothetical protein